jgi:hypothetical protein
MMSVRAYERTYIPVEYGVWTNEVRFALRVPEHALDAFKH